MADSERGVLRRVFAVIASMVAVVGVTGVLATPVAANMQIDFESNPVVFGDPGTVTQVAEAEVDASYVGQVCLMAAVAENQSSVHPGNDLIVSTGSSQAVIIGVEDTANGGPSERYAITLGERVTVQLRFGQDSMSSLGFTLDIDCDTPLEDAGPVTTIEPATTTTIEPATTVPPQTTTVPPQTTTETPVSVAVFGCGDGSTTNVSGANEACSTSTTACDDSVISGSSNAEGTSVAQLDAQVASGCAPETLCPDGSVAVPVDGSDTGCPATTTVVATVLTCPEGAAPVVLDGATEQSCPVASVTDLPETPTAVPVVAAPAYTG